MFILGYSSQFSVTQSCLSQGVGVGTEDFEAWPDPRQIFSSTALNPRPGFWQLLFSGNFPQTWKEEIATNSLKHTEIALKSQTLFPKALYFLVPCL